MQICRGMEYFSLCFFLSSLTGELGRAGEVGRFLWFFVARRALKGSRDGRCIEHPFMVRSKKYVFPEASGLDWRTHPLHPKERKAKGVASASKKLLWIVSGAHLRNPVLETEKFSTTKSGRFAIKRMCYNVVSCFFFPRYSVQRKV